MPLDILNFSRSWGTCTEISETKKEMRRSLGDEDVEGDDTPLWIHVGVNLVYNVGGSTSCGVKMILLDLDKEYRQTAKIQFALGPEARMPLWNTALGEEITNRKVMKDAAES